MVSFSSLSDKWNTPEAFYQILNNEFRFDFDPCPENPTFDGLNIDWGRRNFVNPPFSEWQKWTEKGYVEAHKGKLVVFLIAARTDTKAFHDLILPFADEIRFIRGRLKFNNSKQPAPFPSMVVIFNRAMAEIGNIEQTKLWDFIERRKRLDAECYDHTASPQDLQSDTSTEVIKKNDNRNRKTKDSRTCGP